MPERPKRRWLNRLMYVLLYVPPVVLGVIVWSLPDRWRSGDPDPPVLRPTLMRIAFCWMAVSALVFFSRSIAQFIDGRDRR